MMDGVSSLLSEVTWRIRKLMHSERTETLRRIVIGKRRVKIGQERLKL